MNMTPQQLLTDLLPSSVKRRPRGHWRRQFCHAMLFGAGLASTGCHALSGAGPAHSASASPVSVRAQDEGLFSSFVRPLKPATATELVHRAAQEYQSGRLETARSTLQKARKIDPTLSTTWELEAEIAFDQGRMDEYVAALRAVLAANPESARLHHQVGTRLLRADRIDEGLTVLKRSCELAPRDPLYARTLAAAYVQHNRTDAAIAALTHATALNPRDTSLSTTLGRLQEAAGRWQLAVDAYSKAIAAAPDQLTWRRHRARCLYELNRPAEAVQDYAICYRHQDRSLTLADHVYYGDCCLQTGELKTAQALFDDLARRYPTQMLEIEIMRGICALRQNDRDRARAIYAAALNRWPDDAELQQLVALCDPTSAGEQVPTGIPANVAARISRNSDSTGPQPKSPILPTRHEKPWMVVPQTLKTVPGIHQPQSASSTRPRFQSQRMEEIRTQITLPESSIPPAPPVQELPEDKWSPGNLSTSSSSPDAGTRPATWGPRKK